VTALTLIDSPFSNAANIARALRKAGAELHVTTSADAVSRADKLVLPGVGSFRAALDWLRANGIDSSIRAAVTRGVPLLGICVGHQLLFQLSEEMGETEGLGLIEGRVERLTSMLPVPQIGWNRVRLSKNRLFAGIADGTPFYFVHSFAAGVSDAACATATYGRPFTAAVERDNVFGVQFHPEKSSSAGLRVLANFVNL
jgi:imidazole glycerol-phosphate synthase subunit HisH